MDTMFAVYWTDELGKSDLVMDELGALAVYATPEQALVAMNGRLKPFKRTSTQIKEVTFDSGTKKKKK